jgi:predicted negative regulator of RcsB-dependent stress response
VDDYLSEKEQWEWLKTQVKESAPWVIAAVAAALLLLSGWRWWQGRADRLGIAASTQYQQIVDAFGRGERARALTLIDALGREQPKSPYVDQANLGAARVFVLAGELDKAGARLKSVMEHTPDRALALVARERLARVQIAQGLPEAAIATLAAVDPGSFAPRFHEVRGDAFEAKRDFAAALKEYRIARADASGMVDPESLELKIGDLVSDEHAPAPPAAALAK